MFFPVPDGEEGAVSPHIAQEPGLQRGPRREQAQPAGTAGDLQVEVVQAVVEALPSVRANGHARSLPSTQGGVPGTCPVVILRPALPTRASGQAEVRDCRGPMGRSGGGRVLPAGVSQRPPPCLASSPLLQPSRPWQARGRGRQ